jgi:hypothetical protein
MKQKPPERIMIPRYTHAHTRTHLNKSSTTPPSPEKQCTPNACRTKLQQPHQNRQQCREKKNRKPILENKAPPQYRIAITTTIAPAPEEEEEATATWVRRGTGLTLLAPPILAFLRNALNDRSPIGNSCSCKNNKALRKKLEALAYRCCFRVLFAR